MQYDLKSTTYAQIYHFIFYRCLTFNVLVIVDEGEYLPYLGVERRLSKALSIGIRTTIVPYNGNYCSMLLGFIQQMYMNYIITYFVLFVLRIMISRITLKMHCIVLCFAEIRQSCNRVALIWPTSTYLGIYNIAVTLKVITIMNKNHAYYNYVGLTC